MYKQVKNEKKYIQNIHKLVSKTIRENNLLNAGDKVLVALSGGKDSLILLESLAERLRHVKGGFALEALHVKAQNINYKIDEGYLASFCKNLKVPLHFKNIYPDLDQDQNKSACFVCSWYRREALFKFTNQNGFNKLALGHHMDDAIETLVMNMLHKASISSLPPKLHMFKGRFAIIRPLLDLTENQLLDYAEIRKFTKEVKSCPYQGNTVRDKTKELLKKVDQQNKNARKNIYRSMQNIYKDYLP